MGTEKLTKFAIAGLGVLAASYLAYKYLFNAAPDTKDDDDKQQPTEASEKAKPNTEGVNELDSKKRVDSKLVEEDFNKEGQVS